MKGDEAVNPWKAGALAIGKDIVRFAIWLGIVINGVMLAIFSILFTGFFLWRAWGWMYREWFAHPW